MVVESLRTADRYQALHASFPRAIAFLRSTEVLTLPEGRYELDGERLVAIVVRKGGKSKRESVLESHVRDIDIHCVLEGTESMGWKPVAECTMPKGPYDADSDCILYDDGPEVWADVPAGSCAIFFPSDAHATMVSAGWVHKVILKVREKTEVT